MNSSFLLVTVAFIFSAISCVVAQPSVEELVKEWERAKAYTEEYLQAMPDSAYGLKPTPEMRSFAEQMLHLTDANYRFAAAAAGEKSAYPLGAFEKTSDQSKAVVMKAVLDGYDNVINTVRKMTPREFAEKITFFDRQVTKEMVLMKLFEHQTHHRGQTTVYLHLADVIPPKEKLF
jgi:uncharacterized damage-inducible protein DinB